MTTLQLTDKELKKLNSFEKRYLNYIAFAFKTTLV